jgi:hypothetical protein
VKLQMNSGDDQMPFEKEKDGKQECTDHGEIAAQYAAEGSEEDRRKAARFPRHCGQIAAVTWRTGSATARRRFHGPGRWLVSIEKAEGIHGKSLQKHDHDHRD